MNSRTNSEIKYDERCAKWQRKWDRIGNEIPPAFMHMKDKSAAKVLTLLTDYACYQESALASNLIRTFSHAKRHYITEVTATILKYYAPEHSRNLPNDITRPWNNNEYATLDDVLSELKFQLNGIEIKEDGELRAILYSVIFNQLKIEFDKVSANNTKQAKHDKF